MPLTNQNTNNSFTNINEPSHKWKLGAQGA